MRFFNKFKQRAAVGVDIGSCAIKIVEARSVAPGEYRLDNAGIEYFEYGAFDESGQIKKPEVVSAAIRRLTQRLGVRTEDAVLALPSTSVSSTWVTVPVEESEVEIEGHAEHEAMQMFPDHDAVNFDFAVEPPNPGEPNKLVQIVAGHRRQIDDFVALTERAGLKPVIMDVETMAVERAMSSMGAGLTLVPPPYIGVYLGNLHSYVFVQDDGHIAYSAPIHVDGSNFVVRMADFLQESKDETAVKIRKQSFEGGANNEWLLQESEYLAQEVSAAIQTAANQFGRRLDKVILSGGNSLMPQLDKMIAGQIEQKVEIYRPGGAMSMLGVGDQGVKAAQAAMVVAVGLAIRGLL